MVDPANKPVNDLQKINCVMVDDKNWKMEPKQEPINERVRNIFLP